MTGDAFLDFVERHLEVVSRSPSGCRCVCPHCGARGTFYAGWYAAIKAYISQCKRASCEGADTRVGPEGILIHKGMRPDQARAAVQDEIGLVVQFDVSPDLWLGKYPVPEDLTYDESILDFYRFVPEYFLNRGLTEETLAAFDIGYDWDLNEVIIPVRNSLGEIKGLTRRQPYATDFVKYCHDFKVGSTLYNIHRQMIGRRKIVVEGQFDVMKMWQLGWRNTVGTLGGFVNRAQAKVLARYAEYVVILADGDEAGLKGLARSWKNLVDAHCYNVRVNILPRSVDPGDLQTADEAKSYIDSAIDAFRMCELELNEA